MFKQLKSAYIWFYIYRFRKKLSLVLTLIFLILLSQLIYSDIVEYLKLRHKLYLLDYILPAKWLFITLAFFYSFYTLLTLFKKTPKNESKDKKIAIKKMSKKEIKKLADEIIAQKKR